MEPTLLPLPVLQRRLPVRPMVPGFEMPVKVQPKMPQPMMLQPMMLQRQLLLPVV